MKLNQPSGILYVREFSLFIHVENPCNNYSQCIKITMGRSIMRKNITKCILFPHFFPKGSYGSDIFERSRKQGNRADMQKSPWLATFMVLFWKKNQKNFNILLEICAQNFRSPFIPFTPFVGSRREIETDDLTNTYKDIIKANIELDYIFCASRGY